jgi:hypothetical protein
MGGYTMNALTAARLAVLLLSGALSGGCALIDPPSGYVELDVTGDKSFLAVSAHGNTLAVSDRRNEGGDQGDLAYWVEAFKHEKVAPGRYRLEQEEQVQTRDGREGVLLDLRLGRGDAEFTWLVAFFVDSSRIVTVEAGGPTLQIAPDRDKLVAAIRTLR